MRRTAFVIILLLVVAKLTAQVDSTSVDSAPKPLLDTHPEGNITGDSFIAGKDSTNSAVLSDTLRIKADTAVTKPPKQQKKDIETTINYTAEDSMYFDLDKRKLYLYGQSHIDYGNITLEAEQTSIDWTERTIKAQYKTDTLGRKRGKPVFSQNNDVYETEDIVYNFKTRKAIIKGVITEKDGAYMHGEDVKKNSEDELFIRGAKYTTCNLSDPHFFIESDKIKVVPGKQVISGPFNMKFREVPTPLWFPFGMFPQPKEKASGIVFPSYGEETRRGFFLRNGGYYFAISDYVDARIVGDIYSKGGYALDATSNYKVRYKFSGAVNLSYTKNITQGEINQSESNSFWVRLNHTPQTRGNSSVSASVSAGSTNYNDQNNILLSDPQRSITSQYTSSVSYNQRFRNLPFSFSSNFRLNQNVQTGIYDVTLPDLSVQVQRFYPLKNVVKNSKSPLAKISLSHNFVAKNQFSNAPLSTGLSFDVINESESNQDTLKFSLDNLGEIYKRADIGGRHSVPISTSFNMLKYFTVSPSFNYQEVWYTRELDYTYVAEENGVRIDTVDGFSRAGSWTSGASVNTRLYGMYYLKAIPGIEAIRHVMTPSLSFTYNPDFGSEDYGVYETIQIDSTGRTQRVSKYQGFAYGSPTGSESKTVGFSLTNNLEMKVRTKKDTANEFKKVKIFDNLSMNTGYNFAADSFKLSNISWNARTSFFNKNVSLTLSGNFDPYQYVENGTESGQQVDRYAWNNGNGLGTLNRLNTAVSINLRPKNSKNKNNDEQQNDGRTDNFNSFDDEVDNSPFGTEEQKEYIKRNPNEYVDFDIPWTLRISYNVNRSKNGLADPEISSHGLQFSGTLGLTEKTQITFNSGYDIKNKDFTQTRLGVVRDLHCWSLNFSWVPFGRYQSFALTIRPKSSLLQDLKLEKRRSFQDFFN
ncbi:putative LPS assembly protein LptD [Marinoscillum pacificum]|uniref:putative LPS assembly protein LptD n=1 Tax=Marinoscillum pacificum TaxID=392723 RepID=UPI00215791C7|nr:putative LPS assembly protein LptD [Marinoscillum pacificum]